LSKIANLEWPSMRGATGVCGGARPSRSIEEETYVCRSSLTHRCLFRRRERAGNGTPSAVLHRAYCRARRGLNLQGLGRYQAMEGGDKEEVSAHSRASRRRSKGRRDHRHNSAYREAIRRPCAIPFDPATFDAAEQPRWPASRPLRHPRVVIIRSCDGRKFDSLAIDFLLGKDFLAFSEP
jgi:hypothetical protein